MKKVMSVYAQNLAYYNEGEIYREEWYAKRNGENA